MVRIKTIKKKELEEGAKPLRIHFLQIKVRSGVRRRPTLGEAGEDTPTITLCHCHLAVTRPVIVPVNVVVTVTKPEGTESADIVGKPAVLVSPTTLVASTL